MSTGIKPGITTAHHRHRQIALLQVDTVHIGNFQFTTGDGFRLLAISTTLLS